MSAYIYNNSEVLSLFYGGQVQKFDLNHGTDHVQWPSCSEKLMGNETHSLLDITMMAFTQANGGDPSVLLPLVDVRLCVPHLLLK